MKHTYLIILVFVFMGSASAQVVDTMNVKPVENKVVTDQKTIRICVPSRAGIISNPPLYVVNNIVLSGVNVMEYIRPAGVEAVYVLKDRPATEKYGVNGKNGVIEITLKKDVQLWSLEELFKNFRIKKRDRNLPVFIELERLVGYNDFYIASDMVKNVEVIASKGELSSQERFIKVWLKPL